jgi:hypothetical protein
MIEYVVAIWFIAGIIVGGGITYFAAVHILYSPLREAKKKGGKKEEIKCMESIKKMVSSSQLFSSPRSC